jgi:hypothetical protein
MGMSSTPTIANLFITIYECNNIIPHIGSYLTMYYKRFIDDHSLDLQVPLIKTDIQGYYHKNQGRVTTYFNICQTNGIISIHPTNLLSSTQCPHRTRLWENPMDLPTLLPEQRFNKELSFFTSAF